MVWRKMLLPMALFVAMGLFAYHQDNLLEQFGVAAVNQAQRAVWYMVHMGLWLAAACLVDRLVEVFFWDTLAARTLPAPAPQPIRAMVSGVIYLVAITGIVAVVFQQPVTGIWIAVGLTALVTGLALRTIILDLFMGLAIHVDRAFRTGDVVLLHPANGADSGLTGRVVDTNWRTTRLLTSEHNTVVIPNHRLSELALTNFSAPDPTRECALVFRLDDTVSTDRALRILSAGVLGMAGTGGILTEPEPKARIAGAGATGVEYTVTFRVDCSQTGLDEARHVVIKSILDQLYAAGLTLAHQQQDIFYAPKPERYLDAANGDSRLRLLNRVDLFAPLDADDLITLACGMKVVQYPERAEVIRQGAPGDSMFIVVEGLLQAYIDFQGTGEAVHVGNIKAGEFFGEMSLLTGEPRSATVRAATNTVVFEITKDQLGDLFQRRPEIAESMSLVVASRRLHNREVDQQATRVEQEAQQVALARQIMGNILGFFRGITESPVGASK